MRFVSMTVQIACLLCTCLSAHAQQPSDDPQEKFYVIETGEISYDQDVPPRKITALHKELQAGGEPAAIDYMDVVDLAYAKYAKETGRISLTFVLKVGDAATSRVTMSDTTVFAQVQLRAADEKNVKANITLQWSGKLGGARGGSGTRLSELPIVLDDREHFVSGHGSFSYFPNGEGQGSARRRYIRARIATAGDLEQQKLNEGELQGAKLLANQEDHPLRLLVLDPQWTNLRLVSPSQYNDYASIEQLPKLLEEKMERETARVRRLLVLTESQAKKLSAALLRHRSQIQKQSDNLEKEALLNPRLRDVDSRQFYNKLNEINEALHQSYFTEGSLTAAIMVSQLNDQQLQQLEQATLDEFVEALANSELEWNDLQAQQVRGHLQKVIEDSEPRILDHQLLLNALTNEFLVGVLDEHQLQRFTKLLKISDKAHYLILNAQRGG